ncbi:hypothetical protein EDI28_24955 [Photobacterium chitinilyticum]|uniref:ArnR1-like winged helix-turn-helix domain-containing protein n=2 Tax=Photobacterium chitinilyticum TaxID=2485123 RepID=A0A3S3QPW4_9GAMM|nr:hypothetical protein EDI28_24955 [Photobacterium chitinilyticum]
MLTIHFIEMNHGLHMPVNTSYLRKKVELSLCKELSRNHFLVSLRTLAENGYLVYQPNTEKALNVNARENESMWQLTRTGRQYAETLNSARLRPKRSYNRRKVLKRK